MRVARETIDRADISTVLLPRNHQHGDRLPFETLIIGGQYDGKCWRYASKEDAQTGHAQIVRCLAMGQKPELRRDNGT